MKKYSGKKVIVFMNEIEKTEVWLKETLLLEKKVIVRTSAPPTKAEYGKVA